MERNRPSQTSLRLILTAAILTEAVAACAPRKINASDATPQALEKDPTTTWVSPPITETPSMKDYLPTQTALPMATTETGVPTPTIDQKFKLGSFDTANTPFTLTISRELNELMGYTKNSNKKALTADIPLPVKIPIFGTPKQMEVFEASALNPFAPNPYYSLLTDQPNHIFTYFHSITDSPGEAARIITRFAMQNPEKSPELLGQTVQLDINGSQVQAEIVHVNVVDNDFFSNFGEGTPWGPYPERDDVLFAHTDRFGIPEEIRTDTTPGTFYLTIIGCQSEDGEKSLFLAENTAKRAMVTLKIKLP